MKEALSHQARLGILLCALALAPFAARALGLSAALSAGHLRELVAQAGALGPLAFVLVFIAAVVAQVPGFGFVIAAPALFRLPEAWILCFIASNLAVVLNFALVRRFGGQPLAELRDRPRLRRLFTQLDQHPIRTVALLRLLTVMFPPLTGALALTQLRARDHAIGSVLGMLLPLTAMLLAAAALLGAVR